MGVKKITPIMLVLLCVLILPGTLINSAGSEPLRQHQLQHYGANRRQFHLLPPLNQILHPLPFLGPFHAKNKLPSRLPSRTRLNNFEHFSAKKQSYSANRRHQQIRRREGTEIFEGRKPDIMHYIEAPQLGQRRDFARLIDERTPVTQIVKESSVPDVI